MPYHHYGPQPDGGSFFNLEQSVGAGGVNNPADVKLVQHMIKKIYGSPADGLVADGNLGQYTIPWINKLQFDARALGCNVNVDGRLNRSLTSIVFNNNAACGTLAMNRALKLRNELLYAMVSRAVPLNSAPPATGSCNADLPNTKEVKNIISSFSSNGWRRTYLFTDGSTETLLDPNMSPSLDQPGHGKAVARYKSGAMLLSIYEDGTQRVRTVG